MKSKLLKKLRKRYTWTWMKPPESKLPAVQAMGHWQILDHYDQRVITEKSAYDFLRQHVVYNIYGVFSGMHYEKQHAERERHNQYRQAKAALNK